VYIYRNGSTVAKKAVQIAYGITIQQQGRHDPSRLKSKGRDYTYYHTDSSTPFNPIAYNNIYSALHLSPSPPNHPSQLLTKEPDQDEEDDYLTIIFTESASATSKKESLNQATKHEQRLAEIRAGLRTRSNGSSQLVGHGRTLRVLHPFRGHLSTVTQSKEVVTHHVHLQ
jgi:hypothetical protein